MADTDSPEEYESSNESSVEEEELEEEQQHRDGLADMMSKILNQKVGDKIPVLSKRKTPMMKEIEGETEEIEKLKRQRIDKKAEKEKQLVVPDASTADFERQLKRLATRGVVALFNAISQSRAASKTDDGEEEGEDGKKKKDKKKKEKKLDPLERKKQLKALTKDLFLDSVKSGTTAAAAAAAAVGSGKGRSGVVGGGEGEEDGFAGEVHEAPKKGEKWAVLRDDFLMDKGTNLKDWDRDVSDNGSDDDEEI